MRITGGAAGTIFMFLINRSSNSYKNKLQIGKHIGNNKTDFKPFYV
jgi:hypothetical protein